MINRAYLLFMNLLLCGSSFAAHIVTETRSGNALVGRTDTYANAAGDLRIDERSYGSKATMSAEGGTSVPEVEYLLSDIEDTTLFQINGETIVSVEGKVCRRMTADSESPPGLGAPGMNLGDANKQMADAMKQASSAIEQAMAQARREGMTAEQQRQLEQLTKPFMEPDAIRPRDTLEVSPLGQRVRVGSYNADGYSIVDQDNVEKHRVWVVPTNEVAGGAHVRKGMLGMFNMYEQYLDKMGGGALMDTGMATLFRKGVLATMYPVRIEDIQAGEIFEVTDIIEAHSGGPAVEFYPKDCTVKTMFEM